ncbi:MAG: hypothetical protein ACLUA4_00870 [Bifidobacterium sp.]
MSNAELHKEITGRTSLEVPPEHTYGTASYYNAFPAAYWAHWTNGAASRAQSSPLLVRARSRCIDRMRMPTIILWLRNR